MTSDEKRHLGAVQSIGCIACRIQGTPGTPAEIHHPREGQGAGQRASHYDAVPLCPAHHRGTDHPRTPSIHLDRVAFIERFGDERELLKLVEHALQRNKQPENFDAF